MRIIVTIEGDHASANAQCAEALQGFVLYGLATLGHNASVRCYERDNLNTEPEETFTVVLVDGKGTILSTNYRE